MENYKKKYEQALDNFKKIKDANKDNKELVDFIEYNYPELKESEDERIRKRLIQIAKTWKDGGYACGNSDEIDDILDWLEKQGHDGEKWIYEDVYLKEREQVFQDGVTEVLENPQKYGLEKQGEQNPTDKVEPKFKVGDWIVRNYQNNDTVIHRVVIIRKIDDETYGYTLDDGTYFSSSLESSYHPWTIKDAKDGDVLSFKDDHGNDCIELIKNITDKKIEFWFCLTNGNRCVNGITLHINLASRENATPATKEQCDLLFSKIKEAGYEWDAEKKELKKIEDTIKKTEQNPAWSEEDERILYKIQDHLREFYVDKKGYPYVAAPNSPEMVEYNWLKSLKDRMKGE